MNPKKMIKIVLVLFLAAAVLYVGDMFLGNPFSYFRVKQHAQDYLEGAYPGQLQLQMDDIYYDWYSGGGYEIDVTSPVSEDTRFMLRYDRLGNFVQDTYDLFVASGSNTLARLEMEYEMLVNDALRNVLGDNLCKTGLSRLDNYSKQPVPLTKGIDPAALMINGEYDVAQLGQEYGYLVLNIYESAQNISIETAAEHLLNIKAAMEDAGVGFQGIELFMTVRDPKETDASLVLELLTYADLESENLVQHLKLFVVE